MAGLSYIIIEYVCLNFRVFFLIFIFFEFPVIPQCLDLRDFQFENKSINREHHDDTLY